MKSVIKIILLIVGITTSYICRSQTEHGLLPYANNLLLNPSYAGINRTSSVWSNYNFFSQPPSMIDQSFTVTYDTWNDRLFAGTALYFYHGVKGELNTVYTGAGFSFNTPLEINDYELIPSFNLSYLSYSKQWLVALLDAILDLERDSLGNPVYQPPGEETYLFDDVIPRIGLMWRAPNFSLGISGSKYKDMEAVQRSHLLFHASGNLRGRKRGLYTRPFITVPELVVSYSHNLLLSRIGLRIERIGSTAGMFLQNDYIENRMSLAGIFGLRSDYLMVNITAGGAWSFSQSSASFFGELSFGYLIPYKFINSRNPWAPPVRHF